MSVLGKCLIEISVTNRDKLISRGAAARSKSYNVVLSELIKENDELNKTNDKISKQNDELQEAMIKIATSNGDNK